MKEHTRMSQFASYNPPEVADGDRYSPKDNIGHVIVVKPGDVKTGIITSNSPGGVDAIAADIVDLDATGGPTVYRDALLFGGALVDGFRNYAGQLVVVELESKTSASGRKYPSPKAANPEQTKRAEAYFATNPDPFAPVFTTVTNDEPPF